MFLYKDHNEHLLDARLDTTQLKVLDEIRQFLAIPHAIQELVSAERTPTLPVALPAYEKLIRLLKLLKSKLPNIAHGIDAAIEKLDTYLAKTRRTRVYALALSKPFISFP